MSTTGHWSRYPSPIRARREKSRIPPSRWDGGELV